MRTTSTSRLIGVVALCATAGCQHSTEPRARFRANAVVTTGAEGCEIALEVGSQKYVPVGLAPSLAVQRLHLRVEGTVRDVPTVCMIGPVLDITSAAPLPVTDLHWFRPSTHRAAAAARWILMADSRTGDLHSA